jgi:heme/copper-type cytochrome/quinol oxidase subunit 2
MPIAVRAVSPEAFTAWAAAAATDLAGANKQLTANRTGTDGLVVAGAGQ